MPGDSRPNGSKPATERSTPAQELPITNGMRRIAAIFGLAAALLAADPAIAGPPSLVAPTWPAVFEPLDDVTLDRLLLYPGD